MRLVWCVGAGLILSVPEGLLRSRAGLFSGSECLEKLGKEHASARIDVGACADKSRLVVIPKVVANRSEFPVCPNKRRCVLCLVIQFVYNWVPTGQPRLGLPTSFANIVIVELPSERGRQCLSTT